MPGFRPGTLTGSSRLRIAEAVKAELTVFPEEFQARRDEQGRCTVGRNGYLPERKNEVNSFQRDWMTNRHNETAVPDKHRAGCVSPVTSLSRHQTSNVVGIPVVEAIQRAGEARVGAGTDALVPAMG